MKFSTISSASALLAATSVAAEGGPWGGKGGPGGPGFGGLPSCLSNCDNISGGVNWSQGGLTSLCGNSTLVDAVNSCVASSSCNSTDKQNTYQVLAQICANAGSPLTASPEATYSATSGGTNYPTGTGQWASYASAFSTMTNAPNAPNGWRPGAGYGPFGQGAPGNGYGPWSGKTGSWTDGPWTQWWGGSACPPSSWSGWTSGPWGTNAPWTTWTACTASSTATGVVTTTVTTAGSTTVMTTTGFGLSVAQATNGAQSGATRDVEVNMVVALAACLAGGLGVVLAL
ncbi:Hypothetical protein D9617_10g073300 [Elsinoe fawcettii]|nr:Hypothetical protein D9617_10g073300 [Elsinoe fawcettii]